MTRKIIAGGLALAALVVTLSAQDSKEPVRVESVKLELDPSSCMGGQTKMAVKLEVRAAGKTITGVWKVSMAATCQLAYQKEIHLTGEDDQTLAVCHVHSNMCTGFTGSGVMDATCKGGEGEPQSDKKTFSCPQQ